MLETLPSPVQWFVWLTPYARRMSWGFLLQGFVVAGLFLLPFFLTQPLPLILEFPFEKKKQPWVVLSSAPQPFAEVSQRQEKLHFSVYEVDC